MLKKTITYKDLDGNDVVEDFYFNLNRAEIAELELSMEGGISSHLEKVVAAQDFSAIFGAFKDIIRVSIGRRSEDGKRFIKNDEIAEEFFQTDAWPTLFMEMGTSADYAAEFMQGILPSDMEVPAKTEDVSAPALNDRVPAYIREDRDPTNAELREMSSEQIREAFMRREAKKKSQ